MNLVTERCIVRNFMLNDVNDLYKTLSDEEVMKYIEPAFDMEKTKEFIMKAGLCETPMVYALVWKENDKVIGHVIFHSYAEDSYEIGWVINKEYWGKGIADEVTEHLVKYAQKLEISSCVIECTAEQLASKHIAEKNGFIYKKQDEGCDVYQLDFKSDGS